MNKHTYQYLSSHDIDLFFLVGEKAIHCATNGGMIPSSLNEIKSINNAKYAARGFQDIIPFENLIINETYLAQVTNHQQQLIANLTARNNIPIPEFNSDIFSHFYLSSFIAMALKGFYSYDRDIFNSADKSNSNLKYSRYTLVVGPSEEYSHELIKRQLFEHPYIPFKDISDHITMTDSNCLTLQVDIPQRHQHHKKI